MPVTILFRGLMVCVRLRTGEMEIGVLRAPGHIPRILTMENGVLASMSDLRLRPELDRVAGWEIEVTNPTPAGVTIHTDGTPEPFNRLAAHPDEDFRWVANLEAADLHGRPLSADLDTRKLRFVIRLQHGKFSTRLKSPELRRKNPDTSTVPYGCMAAVTECAISFGAGGRVRLMAGGTEIFTFGDKANTLYEISNSPPDVDPGHPHPTSMGHFSMYYDHLFVDGYPREKYDLVLRSASRAPDPALCGVTYLGLRDTPL